MIGLHLLVTHWKRLGFWLALLGLGIYIVMLKSSLAAERQDAARWQAEAAQRGHMLAAQNAAIAELHRASEQRRKAAAKARKQARATGEKLEASARRLEAARPIVAATCPTPKEVLGIEADLSSGRL